MDEPPVTHRLGRTLQSQSGAFDLTSVLVGSAVVAILVGGVATNGFGVIPWAQDNAARQELEVIRTAQGAAKVREGRFADNAVLGSSGYLQGVGQVATTSDSEGNCYTSVSKSSTDRLYIATDSAISPVELTAGTGQSCVTSTQLMSLVAKVDGQWPGFSSGGAVFAPFSATNGHSQKVVDALNAELGLEGSAENLLASSENTDEAWAAWDSSQATATYNAAYYALTGDINQYIVWQQMLNRPDGGVLEARDASRSAAYSFYWDPNTVTQQAYVDTMHSYFQTALDQPPIALVPDATYEPIPVTPGAEEEARYANAYLAYYSSSLVLYDRYGHVHGWMAWPIADAWNASAAGTEWNTVQASPAGWAMQDRKDSGIPALLSAWVQKHNAYDSLDPRPLEQMIVQRQEYVDALRAYFAVATVPAK